MTKLCTSCGVVKDESEFYRQKQKGRYYPGAYCKPCHGARTRARSKEKRAALTTDERRAYDIGQRYGLSFEQYGAMLAAQGGKCAICDSPFTTTPHVDHDHATGKVRGLLCNLCNPGLGKFMDSPERLRRAALYLEEHGRADL